MSSSAARRHVLAVVTSLLVVAPTLGQDDTAQLLEEFIHYTLIAKPDLAAAYAQKLLETGVTNAELAEAIDEDTKLGKRFDEALGQAHRVPELELIAAEMERRVTEGRLELARDPQRIERAISMLTGTQREQLFGRQMLIAAGEYAVPRLLVVIVEGKDERLRDAAGNVLVDIGREAVSPLCVALHDIDDRNQRFVCRVLADIKLPHAAPYLMELAVDPTAAEATRRRALAAFEAVGAPQGDLSVLYEQLGAAYFNDSESLIAYPFESVNNVWFYNPMYGLEAVAVPTEIFFEVMAMRMAAKSLDVDPGNDSALSLFVAANLKRENELPRGADDPIYGENQYTPSFYATVFGTQTCLDVLAMGIDRIDTTLVRDAIAALAQTTGGSNLFTGGDVGRRPLLEALRYPDRRVQYEAALTLGAALPSQRFTGDLNVVPLLASAVRTGDEAFAVIVAGNEEDRRIIATRLDDLGFTIVAAGPTFQAVRAEVAAAVGVDLVVVQGADGERAVMEVGEVHVFPQTAATPVLIVAAATDLPVLKREYRDDVRVKVSRSRVSDSEFNESVDEVMLRAAGGRMTEAEAEGYAIEAIMTLRDIAIAGNTAFAIGDAEPALIQALAARSGQLRLMVADILALLESPRAQQTLFDAALAASGEEQINLLDRVAESVKRFGDHTDRRHVDALLDLIVNSGGETAEAAARVHGALNLPAGAAIELIP